MNKAAAILCGGKSTRMKSPKALLPFGKTTLLNYQFERFSKYFDRIYISISAQMAELLDKSAFEGAVFIEDEYFEIGPMGGICSVLKGCSDEAVFCTGVDAPFTDVSFAAELFDALLASQTKAACTFEDLSGSLQPLFCAYSKKALPVFEELINRGDFRLKNIFSKENTLVIKNRLLPSEQFFNMNDASSYYAALKKLSLKEPEAFPPGFASESSQGTPFTVSFAAKSGTGKTTCLERVIPILKEKGLRVAVIKHDVHGIEIDKPKKDSFRLRQAGADIVILSSEEKTFCTLSHKSAPELSDLISQVKDADIIITEGYKFENLPKICLLRNGYSMEPVCSPENIIAYVADFPYESDLPVFDLNNPSEIANFLIEQALKAKQH